MNYLFTSESVSEGHPDKVADQISDAILDEFLRQDPHSHVACETFCTSGLVIVGGEVSSENAYVDIDRTVRGVIDRIGYNKAEYGFDASSCGVISTIHEQSADISRGVDRGPEADQGAGDQGIMFGYACKETPSYMPLPLYLSHKLLQLLADYRKSGDLAYLRPDAKAQFTVEYDADTHKPVRIHTIVLSTQHDEFDTDEKMHAGIEQDIRRIVLPTFIKSLPEDIAKLFDGKAVLHVNPTGKFVIGGPAGDTGLTGRKIIVDTYGGRGAHGGGAFSGKDPSKVDRSAAYAARWIAKNIVAAGIAEQCLVQLAYAIGVAKPLSVYVDTYGTAKQPDAEIAEKISELFDLRPAAIIKRFGLTNPIYSPTAAYGHFGREPYTEKVTFLHRETDPATGDVVAREQVREVEFFPWEKLDAVDSLRKAFALQT
ncbi:MAG: methionine adenosyltransferase [Bacteroidales bacterium]|nr:methionine adenosyltransferase [Bacteroidales bacterium]